MTSPDPRVPTTVAAVEEVPTDDVSTELTNDKLVAFYDFFLAKMFGSDYDRARQSYELTGEL